jgi:hypothetical protein
MSPLTQRLPRPALLEVKGAGDLTVRQYEQVAGAFTASRTVNAYREVTLGPCLLAAIVTPVECLPSNVFALFAAGSCSSIS